MLKTKYILVFVLLLMLSLHLYATHNRAGEITYEQIDEFTYRITITTFTNTKPTTSGWPPVDRPELEIDFGDNTTAIVPRAEKIDLPDYYRKNTYITTHTFPGPGTYSLVVEDPNRNEGVANIPNSVAVVFSIKTIMQINPALGPNTTPQLLSPPVDKAAKNRIFIHNPAAWDPDGDSLSYKLTPCTGENGQTIDGFQFPEGVTINEITGDLIWDKPTEIGVYNVAILIEEWREDVKIGQITRDLQIEVYETDNLPPEVRSNQEICLQAGDSFNMPIKAFDPDKDSLILTPLGGAFDLDSPANFYIDSSQNDTTFAHLSWKTNCQHIRKQPYLVVIKAEDKGNEIALADLHHIRIWVNGPATQFTSVESTNNSITLNWFEPNCAVTGYQIYRKKKSYTWDFDVCLTGIPTDAGYQKIASADQNTLEYTDNNQGNGLVQGYKYCYRAVPKYGDASGYASADSCATLQRGIPVITKVSIKSTDSLNGKIYIAWSRPTEIDTTAHPGPYTYKIFRSDDLWGESFTNNPVALLQGLNDTIMTDSMLNTLQKTYSYKVELHNESGLISQPMTASAICLKASGADNQISLKAKHNVPWLNETYSFYHIIDNEPQLLNEQDSNLYIHNGLQNEKKYQYWVKTTGEYTENGIINPIVNYSQIASSVPIDTIAPSPPELKISANCDAYYNILKWHTTDDEVQKVNVYYAPEIDHSLSPIASFPYPDTTQFQHQPQKRLSGCYAVTAIDSGGNESSLSAKNCIDSCDYYELPNVITVNNDGKNDIFRPIAEDHVVQKMIHKANIKIYNRYGMLVYETSNPLILWDGKNKNTRKIVPTGVYYYVCNLKEKRISGIEERYKVGFLHVYDSKQ